MTTASYSKGLAGVIADETSICLVDGEQGALYYRGHSIEDLAEEHSFDAVCYLLLYGELPSEAQLKSYRDFMAQHYALPSYALQVITSLPKDKHPMEVVMAVLPLLGEREAADIKTERIAEGDTKRTQVLDEAKHREEMLSVLAKVPTIVAAYQRHRSGQPVVEPNGSMDLLTNFLAMFHGEAPEPRDVEIFSVCEILQMEHGFNASTFTARVVASTLAPAHASLAAAVGALYGKLHGGADEAAFRMARDQIGFPDQAEGYVDQLLAKSGKIMGLGHRVYKAMDPRAKILKRLATELTNNKGGDKQNVFQTLLRVEEVMADRMAAKGKKIYPNVEFFKGPVFNALDIPTDQFTAMFVIARAFGWAAHILELWKDHRIYRPRAMYVGPKGH